MSYIPASKQPGWTARLEHKICGCGNPKYLEHKTLSYTNRNGYVHPASTALPDGSYRITLSHCTICGHYEGRLSQRRGYYQAGLDWEGKLMPALAYALWGTEDAAYFARIGREKGDPAYYSPEERKEHDIAYYDNRSEAYLGYAVGGGSVSPTEPLWSGATTLRAMGTAPWSGGTAE